jgi:hypothetical protein
MAFDTPTDTTPTPQAPPAATSPATPAATPTPAQPTQQAPEDQSVAGANQSSPAPATAPASALPPSKTGGVHGVLGGILMGALAGAAHVASAVGRGVAKAAPYIPVVAAAARKNAEAKEEIATSQQNRQIAGQKAQQAQTKSMDDHTEATLRTNGISLDNMHKVAENAHLEEMYKGQEQEQRNTLMTQNRAQNEADRDILSTLESMGVHIDTSHGPGHANLTQDHAQAVATGKQTMLSNGKEGDDAGYGFVNNDELRTTVLPTDVKVATDWTLNPKTGAITPVYSTLKAGQNTAFDALIGHDAGMKKFNQLQGMYGEQLKNKQVSATADKDAAEATAQRASAALNEAYSKQIGGGGAPGATPTAEVAQAISQLPPNVQKDLQQYDPGVQGLLVRGAGGWIDPNTFPQRLTKGGIGILRSQAAAIMTEINPNWTDSLYSNIKKTQSDYVTGKEGQAIRSFNQFLVHAATLQDVSSNFQRTQSPWFNKPLNEAKSQGLGDPQVNEMTTAVEAARQEWQSFIDSGYKPDADQAERAAVLMSDKSSPAQIAGVLGVMGEQAVGRLDQLNESYRTVTGIDYPNLVSPSGKQAAAKLGLGAAVSKYGSGGSYNTSRTPNTSPQTPQPVYANGKLIGHTTDGKTMTPVANQ